MWGMPIACRHCLHGRSVFNCSNGPASNRSKFVMLNEAAHRLIPIIAVSKEVLDLRCLCAGAAPHMVSLYPLLKARKTLLLHFLAFRYGQLYPFYDRGLLFSDSL